MKKPLAFISYRRDDEGPASRFIKDVLDQVFGPQHIFMDVDSIRKADNWRNTINENINECDCLIVIIGKNWLKLQNEYFMRRIDCSDDWVRREIETALHRNIKILPLFLGGTLPTDKALPKTIRKLMDNQGMNVSVATWRKDMSELINALVGMGFRRRGKQVPFPDFKEKKGLDGFPLHLSDDELVDALKDMEGWEITHSPVPGRDPLQMEEISKHYEFKTFEDVVSFLGKTQPRISKIDHHPRWEIIWVTLVVHFCTWDIGYRVSRRDIEMAKMFDSEFEAYYKEK
jgi:pterin-4a-carbinolamine dehydratase